jgi:hypothetical protein
MKSKKLDQLIETLTGIRAGKPWQFKRPLYLEWEDPQRGASPILLMSWDNEIRLKPWTLPPPPVGKQWHRGAEFTEADLPEGCRPLLVGEEFCIVDEYVSQSSGKWIPGSGHPTVAYIPGWSKIRTKCPLPVKDPYAELKAAHAAGKVIQLLSPFTGRNDILHPPAFDDLPERYRVKPDLVPLCKDDIPTGSGLRNLKFYPDMAWVGISRVDVKGVATDAGFYSYEALADKVNAWEIQRHGQDWQPCHKDAP